tara:strand:+ start:1013 stop:1396 length:384 start_codon:yes stop_codon:yes gene_type:complete
MNCLKIDPNNLIKKIDNPRREYNYSILDSLNEYNIPVGIYYQCFLSIEEFKLKNLWNHTIIRWNKMKLNLSENKGFLESKYSKNEYHQIHKDMNDKEFHNLFDNFIQKDLLKSLFVCNCIQNYISPK